MATPDPAALAETPIEDHAAHSARMLEHAAEMIERGERLQASEKMWGAVAQRLIAIARARGWQSEQEAPLPDLPPGLELHVERQGTVDQN